VDAPPQKLESNRQMRLRRTVPAKKPEFAAKPAAAKLDPAEARAAKRERAKMSTADAAAAKVKLSSAVNLLAPTGGAAGGSTGVEPSAPSKKKRRKLAAAAAADGEAAPKRGETVVIAEALMPFHPAIRTYMSLQKFVEPTEVREEGSRVGVAGVGHGGLVAGVQAEASLRSQPALPTCVLKAVCTYPSCILHPSLFRPDP